MSKEFQPLGNKVLVKPLDRTKTKGGLYIPEMAKLDVVEGIVLGVGEKVKSIKVGDQLVFNRYTGIAIEFEGEKLHLLDDDDAMGKVVTGPADLKVVADVETIEQSE